MMTLGVTSRTKATRRLYLFLLQYNPQRTLCKFQVYKCPFDTFMCRNGFTAIVLANTSVTFLCCGGNS